MSDIGVEDVVAEIRKVFAAMTNLEQDVNRVVTRAVNMHHLINVLSDMVGLAVESIDDRVVTPTLQTKFTTLQAQARELAASIYGDHYKVVMINPQAKI